MRNAILLLAALLPARAEISPLHPRLFVRHDTAAIGKGRTVAELRKRAHDPAFARWRAAAAGQGAAAMVERAARYLEDRDPADLAAVREFLLTRTFSYEKNDVGGFLAGAEMAAAYDWVHAGLSESERAAAMANIVTTAESSRRFLTRGGPDINHNYTYMALNTVAACGLALHGEPDPYGKTAAEYLDLAREFIEGRVLPAWTARQGAWGEGSHYTFHETLRNLVLMFAAYRTASDADYFRRAGFLAQAGRFLIGSTRPDLTFERIGDCSPNRVTANLTVPVTVEMLAEGIGGDEAARLRSFSDALLEAYGEKAVHPAFGWGMRIYHEPRAPRAPSYKMLPLAMRMGAGTFDQIVLRSGWPADSTQITILAGDHYTDHQHFDKGHFLVYRWGGLAIDGGGYDAMYKPGGHWNEYAVRTVAHNCVLVHDPAQQFPKGNTNDGGQNVHRSKQHHRDWPTYVEHAAKEGLDTANVLAFDHDEKNGYDYVRIDLQPAYSEKVTRYDRQFVYLRGSNSLIVMDRVTSARPEYRKRWLLHFQDRPAIDGAAPEPGVAEFPGARTVSVRHGGGALFVHTLLPAERSVFAIGGPGFEYFNSFDGVNYPPSRPGVTAEPRESGTWRMEVAPARAAADDVFLHVLEIADQPAGARLVEGRGVTGALVQSDVVLFPAEAALPLSYEVASSGPVRHILSELAPGRRVLVEINGRRALEGKANAQGVLSFRDTVRGSRKVAIREAK